MMRTWDTHHPPACPIAFWDTHRPACPIACWDTHRRALDRMTDTCKKTLPCPKLRLRVMTAIIYCVLTVHPQMFLHF